MATKALIQLSTYVILVQMIQSYLVWDYKILLEDPVTLLKKSVQIDYPGGWILPERQKCVDICQAFRFGPSSCDGKKATHCALKAQIPGSYDYLILEQLFLPQFCRELLDGNDPTLSHRSVGSYPNGVRCNATEVQNILSIHGLWPTNYAGYPACCNISDSIRNRPFDPISFEEKYPEVLQDMRTSWIDPVQANSHDTLCELYNHEFQKHGLCYTQYGTNFESAAMKYFTATLDLNHRLRNANSVINLWAEKSAKVQLFDIQKIYTKQVHVLCSPNLTTNQLLSIRTCWGNQGTENESKHQIDCPTQTGFICKQTQEISIEPYIPPSATSD